MVRNNVAKKLGFSLLELVVTISIMGILSVIAIPTISTILNNNRDSKRIADLEVISDALEQYRSNNGFYPFPDSTGNAGWNVASNIQGFSGYLKTIPADPTSSSNCPGYLYAATQTNTQGKPISYTLFAALENTTSKAATSQKPAPKGTPFRTGSGSITYRVAASPASACSGTTYYYWINSP